MVITSHSANGINIMTGHSKPKGKIMKFENTEVFNFAGALRGMRNPMESWDKSDSKYKGYCSTEDEYVDDSCGYDACCHTCNWSKRFFIGENDMKLAQSLIRAGSEHRKFMRQIFVSVDITAPLYWWKEFDTYKVGTVANSTSTMHRLASTPITKDCFEMDDFEDVYSYKALKEATLTSWWDLMIDELECLRIKYNETKDKRCWKELIRLLPDSWLQRRTVTMNYENLLVMCSKGQRRFHKLTEWSNAFIDWARKLPYAQELIFIDETQKQEGKNENGN